MGKIDLFSFDAIVSNTPQSSQSPSRCCSRSRLNVPPCLSLHNEAYCPLNNAEHFGDFAQRHPVLANCPNFYYLSSGQLVKSTGFSALNHFRMRAGAIAISPRTALGLVMGPVL